MTRESEGTPDNVRFAQLVWGEATPIDVYDRPGDADVAVDAVARWFEQTLR